jgi:hypothetical protein
VTRPWAGQPRNRDLIPGKLKGHFSSPKGPNRFWGTHSLLFNRQHKPCLGLRLSELKVDHSSPYSAEVKNRWNFTFNSPATSWRAQVYWSMFIFHFQEFSLLPSHLLYGTFLIPLNYIILTRI